MTALRAAFLIMDAGLGGHTRTAASIATALRERGHEITFHLAAGADSGVIEQAGFPPVRLRELRSGSVVGLADHLARHGPWDALHTFSRRGLVSGAAAARHLRIPFYWTICGGRTPRAALAVGCVIALSEELGSGLRRQGRLPPDRIVVEPGRMDVDRVRAQLNDHPRGLHEAFRRRYGIAPTSSILLRIARVAGPYATGILQGAEAAARLRERGHDLTFVHIGTAGAGSDEALPRIDRCFRELNTAAGAVVAVSARDEAVDAVRYVSLADVVIGAGRSAFEGMLAGKPVVVVGPNGFAGVCEQAHLDRLAHHNFAGRDVEAPIPWDESVGQLCAAVSALLDDGERRSRAIDDGLRHVHERVDVRRAAETYERLYRLRAGEQLPSRREIGRYALVMLDERVRRKATSVLHGWSR